MRACVRAYVTKLPIPHASNTGVWHVRSHPSVPGVFREMPELALRSVPRSIALSLEPDLEDLVDPSSDVE